MSQTKVYIGNLPNDAVQADIMDIMKHMGWSEQVMKECDIHLVRDKVQDKFKGFAYVDVRTEERVKEFLKLNGSEFADKTLKIDRATPKQETLRKGSRGGHQGNFRNDHCDSGRGRGGSRGSFHGKSGDRTHRGRRNSDKRSPEGESKQTNDSAETVPSAPRTRLILTPQTTDPVALAEKKRREEEEYQARKAKICMV